MYCLWLHWRCCYILLVNVRLWRGNPLESNLISKGASARSPRHDKNSRSSGWHIFFISNISTLHCGSLFSNSGVLNSNSFFRSVLRTCGLINWVKNCVGNANCTEKQHYYFQNCRFIKYYYRHSISKIVQIDRNRRSCWGKLKAFHIVIDDLVP